MHVIVLVLPVHCRMQLRQVDVHVPLQHSHMPVPLHVRMPTSSLS